MDLKDIIVILLLVSLVSLSTVTIIGDLESTYSFNVSPTYNSTYGRLSTVTDVTETTDNLEVGLNETEFTFADQTDNIFDYRTISSVLGAVKDSITFITGDNGLVRSITSGLKIPRIIANIIISIIIITVLAAIASLFLRRSV